MKSYDEFQVSWVMVVVMIICILGMTLLYFFQVGSKPLTLVPYLASMLVFILSLVFACGMATRIEHRMLTLSFGIGLIRKTIDLQKVSSVSIEKNPWYYGRGVRMIPGGWLYNVSGDKSVEIRFRDSKKIIRIGTQEPNALLETINRSLAASEF